MNEAKEQGRQQAYAAASTGADVGQGPSTKKPSRKRWITAGVVAVVVIAAAIGFWTWHEQPSFCGAICHTPMDNYLATYEQENGVAGVDKWGNAVENTAGMMAVVHREAGDTCMSCHVPTLSEQIGEGVAWVSGGYQYPLNETDLAALTAASGKDNDSFCLNEACHTNDDGTVMTRQQLEARTSNFERNPHEVHHQELECSTCHKGHRASVNYCSNCHRDAPIPDGWISAAEEAKLSRSV